jgi:hypothetical protein
MVKCGKVAMLLNMEEVVEGDILEEVEGEHRLALQEEVVADHLMSTCRALLTM